MVIAIPVPFIVQGYNKEVALFQVRKHLLTAGNTGHRVAKWSVEPGKGCGLEKKGLNLFRFTRQHFFHGFTKLHRDISIIRKPTIAMINGAAVGSGMDMALHCDIRIGCEKTRFIGYQQAGQIMENGGSYYLPKMVGLGRALEFAYTGSLTADRAYEWGLLNHLVESDDLEATTRELCERIIAMPPLVQWTSKRIMRAALDSTLETTMVLTSNAGGILQSSDDAKEARKAFVEKRKPKFRGV